ncbi:hypothetical protein D3C72_2202030 [compost metagenome]
MTGAIDDLDIALQWRELRAGSRIGCRMQHMSEASCFRKGRGLQNVPTVQTQPRQAGKLRMPGQKRLWRSAQYRDRRHLQTCIGDFQPVSQQRLAKKAGTAGQ